MHRSTLNCWFMNARSKELQIRQGLVPVTITNYQEVLIFLIQVWTFFMVSLRSLFDPLTGKVTMFLRYFPPLLQVPYDSREKATDSLLLVKSVWLQHLLTFLVGCSQSPLL